MGYAVIAPVSKNVEPIYIGIKEFPTDRIFLLCPEENQTIAEDVKKDLQKFKILVNIQIIKGPLWEELFRLVSEIAAKEQNNNVIVNVGAGDSTTKCASISAAFVNGLKAFDVVGKESMLLPVLKFSYYKLLTDKKLKLLKILHEQQDCCSSLDDLGKRAKMSLPLISYHINGTLESDGLKQMGLVEVISMKRNMTIKLSTLGRLLIKGYIN